jgi:predicted secreted Zn-dependent protease
MIKYVNGIAVEMTQEEINKHNDLALSSAEQLEEALNFLRAKRNSLLAQTDYLALSDQTMSAEMTTYRQALRDITNGLTTVADVEAVVFPEKPEV